MPTPATPGEGEGLQPEPQPAAPTPAPAAPTGQGTIDDRAQNAPITPSGQGYGYRAIVPVMLLAVGGGIGGTLTYFGNKAPKSIASVIDMNSVPAVAMMNESEGKALSGPDRAYAINDPNVIAAVKTFDDPNNPWFAPARIKGADGKYHTIEVRKEEDNTSKGWHPVYLAAASDDNKNGVPDRNRLVDASRAGKLTTSSTAKFVNFFGTEFVGQSTPDDRHIDGPEYDFSKLTKKNQRAKTYNANNGGAAPGLVLT